MVSLHHNDIVLEHGKTGLLKQMHSGTNKINLKKIPPVCYFNQIQQASKQETDFEVNSACLQYLLWTICKVLERNATVFLNLIKLLL